MATKKVLLLQSDDETATVDVEELPRKEFILFGTRLFQYNPGTDMYYEVDHNRVAKVFIIDHKTS